MSLTYKHLDADDKKAVEAEVAERDKDTPPAVDASLLAAWERDHYAHAVLLAKATDSDERQAHADAMATIEAALTEHSR